MKKMVVWPAAAVIPASVAYMNVVAVKKPVVGFEDFARGTLPNTSVRGITVPQQGKVLRHAESSTARLHG